MAYHTRRSGPQGMGRGTPPMMYQQQQQQRTNARSSPGFGNSRNSNSLQSSPTNYQGNVTQSQPPLSNNSNYSQQHQTQQQLQQHLLQKQPQQPQQVKQELPVKEEPMQTTLSSTLAPPPPPPPTLMESSAVVERPESMDMKDDDEENGGEPKAKPWLKKKLPGFKVNKKLKRRRQNARLRKILQPKNAIMVLNELKTGIKFTFQEHTNALTQTMFVVNAEVDGKTYTGQGLSKPLAKQNAAENALKDLLLQKMADAAIKVMNEVSDTPEPMVADTSSTVGDTDSVDGTSDAGKPTAPEDDVPWGSLASFALYKLFTEWQSQGTHVPITKTPAGSPSQVVHAGLNNEFLASLFPPAKLDMYQRQLPTMLMEKAMEVIQPAKPTAPAPMKKIPDNPTERHPVMLLNQLRPGVEFKEVSREGTPPNLVFTLSVTVDSASYTGVAKNKKDAKKEAAKAALAGSFNIKYD